ncbi:MAG: metallophosphoesterase [Ignavibacteriae bacterium]|nr:metallophosphoesterase [Ignavibacteria bacterium]MBI3364350.1 metallophosphoesterase [Ignavibacteriota bacterium]
MSTQPSNTTHKVQRAFGSPVALPKPHPRFIPIPDKSIKKPKQYSLSLDSILSDKDIRAITKNKKLIVHMAGDTGGINGTETQEAIAYQMEKQIQGAPKGQQPSFFYNLGDVVYYNGLLKHYEDQFYDPYKTYPAVIFAIPGNHDCDTSVRKGDEPDNEPSLTGFIENFCDKKRRPVPFSPYRYSMNQPYPYWTLDAPFLTVIGLFSNVDGSLDHWDDAAKPQYTWLVDQLKTAPKDKCLFVTVHHPPFSLDTVHGGYIDILEAIDAAAAAAQRHPDAVFSGHVHDYQRFTRTLKGKAYPYIIAGAAGYVNQQRSMHKLQRHPNNDLIAVPFHTRRKDLVLEYYDQKDPGFLRVVIDKSTFAVEYFVNTWDGSKPPVNAVDSVTYDWKNNVKM